MNIETHTVATDVRVRLFYANFTTVLADHHRQLNLVSITLTYLHGVPQRPGVLQ